MKITEFHEIGSLGLHSFLSLPDRLNVNNCDFEGRLSDQLSFIISFPKKKFN